MMGISEWRRVEPSLTISLEEARLLRDALRDARWSGALYIWLRDKIVELEKDYKELPLTDAF
jgi:hypothetical protein